MEFYRKVGVVAAWVLIGFAVVVVMSAWLGLGYLALELYHAQS